MYYLQEMWLLMSWTLLYKGMMASVAHKTMMGGWVGRHLLNTKDNYKDKHSRKHSHPYQHKPNLGLLMANLSWGKEENRKQIWYTTWCV